jgi:hypothetical protein
VADQEGSPQATAQLPLPRIGDPTNPRIAEIVRRIRRYSPTAGWYITASDFVAALNRAGLLAGIDPGADGPPIAVAADITTSTVVTRDGAHFWQNINSSGGVGLIAQLPAGTRVGWRYNYNSSYAVVLWYQPSTWGFILRGSIACCRNDGSPN